MNSIHDITDYIILRVKSEDRFASLINLKLQKLLYYVQAWSYGINKKPMFDGEFEAWIHGPVNREIYNRFNSTKYLYSEINIDDCMNHNVSLSSEDAEFIDFILENYLKYSGAELERLSHNEMPWIETRGDLNVNERCDKVITPELMIEYYGKENTSQKELTPKILEFVKRDYTVLYTDEWLGYNAVDKMFYHYSVDHGKGKYVDGRIYTNTIEGFWSIFKRGIIGIYHHISKKHLQLYANEFTFRYNTRKIKDSSKFKLLLRNSYFKITYLDIIAA